MTEEKKPAEPEKKKPAARKVSSWMVFKETETVAGDEPGAQIQVGWVLAGSAEATSSKSALKQVAATLDLQPGKGVKLLAINKKNFTPTKVFVKLAETVISFG